VAAGGGGGGGSVTSGSVTRQRGAPGVKYAAVTSEGGDLDGFFDAEAAAEAGGAAAAVQSADEEDEQEEAWRTSKVAAARVAAATGATGADREWWEFSNTGDPLLDRHITRLDLEQELAWNKAEPGALAGGCGGGVPGGAWGGLWFGAGLRCSLEAPVLHRAELSTVDPGWLLLPRVWIRI